MKCGVRSMARENSIVSSILEYINSLPCSIAEKVQGTALSSGKADINACVRGRCVRIEVKTIDHNNKPSKKQHINLRRWASKGAVCIVAYTVNDVKSVITKDGYFRREYRKEYSHGMVAERVL